MIRSVTGMVHPLPIPTPTHSMKVSYIAQTKDEMPLLRVCVGPAASSMSSTEGIEVVVGLDMSAVRIVYEGFESTLAAVAVSVMEERDAKRGWRVRGSG